MEQAINLYGTLILTLVGFIVPIITIILSLFPQGTRALSEKYADEKKQSDENIINENKKISDGTLNYRNLQETLKSLEKKSKNAEEKLKYLKPEKLLFKITFPFFVALIAILPLYFSPFQQIALIVLLLTSSFSSFFAGIYNLVVCISVLFEVSEITSSEENSKQERILNLLSGISEKIGIDNSFIKPEEIRAKMSEVVLTEGIKFDYSVNTKHEIPISISNISPIMAKTVELGFHFPKDALIEKTNNLSIYTVTNNQIIRFNADVVHAHEDLLQGKMLVTFLSVGVVTIRAFLKGENVKHKAFSFKINVVK